MLESGSSGSARGASRNGRLYREPAPRGGSGRRCKRRIGTLGSLTRHGFWVIFCFISRGLSLSSSFKETRDRTVLAHDHVDKSWRFRTGGLYSSFDGPKSLASGPNVEIPRST